MLKVHTRRGETLTFDLESPADAEHWLACARDSTFQAGITALMIEHAGVQYTVPRPSGLAPCFMFAERDDRAKGAECLVVHAGEISLALKVHSERRSARVDVSRPGKQRYNPHAR